MRLDFVRKRLELEQPRRFRALLGQSRGRAQEIEVTLDLLRPACEP